MQTAETKSSDDASQPADDVEPLFSRGDYVEARFGGKEEWYPGIVARHEGSERY